MRNAGSILSAALLLTVACAPREHADLLLRGGLVYDGTGAEPSKWDIGIAGDRIVFVGDSTEASLEADTVMDLDGLMVTPGFIDMHSHAELAEDYGRSGAAFLHQGITTVVLGVDGAGTPRVDEKLALLSQGGIGVNALTYVGHGTIRREVLGMENRAPTDAELQAMRELVRQGMNEGAFGLSTGLFYTPGFFASTEEVIELARVVAEYGGIYDTHDRDLGASYQGIGFVGSIREGIEIGESSGARVIFSHFNPQGAHNYGRAPEGAKLIDEARARGVDVAAAQHVYTATQSSLSAYTIPRWASDGGEEAMLLRLRDPESFARIASEMAEMLAIRGGAEKIRIVDPRPELNGRTLTEVATAWGLTIPETVRRILEGGSAAVMNLDLYDMENTRFLATRDWMMTCTDGRDPRPDQVVSHPRVFGAFTKKLRLYVLDEPVITMPFAIRSMSGLAAEFLRLEDRGRIRVGAVADIAVFQSERIRDRATYEEPRRFSEGTVHVLVNGRFAIRDGELTGALLGVPIYRSRKADSDPAQPAKALASALSE
ncbi:MAG TPA: amidohydrolase family protein [Vicinamibacteria bacterium]|nr:amidohydrolase family protein [Vicinamibacteria bacterium]